MTSSLLSCYRVLVIVSYFIMTHRRNLAAFNTYDDVIDNPKVYLPQKRDNNGWSRDQKVDLMHKCRLESMQKVHRRHFQCWYEEEMSATTTTRAAATLVEQPTYQAPMPPAPRLAAAAACATLNEYSSYRRACDLVGINERRQRCGSASNGLRPGQVTALPPPPSRRH